MSRFRPPRRAEGDAAVRGTSEAAARKLEDSERARRMAAQRARSRGERPPPRRENQVSPAAPEPPPIHPDGLRAVAEALGRRVIVPYLEQPSDTAFWERAIARLDEIAAENEKRRDAG